MVSKDSMVLDTGTLRPIFEPETRRVTFPRKLEQADIVEPSESVFWAVDEEAGEAVISRDRDWLREQFDVVEESKVTEQLVATVPHTLFEDHGLFTDAERVFFVADEDELLNDACRMVTEADMLDAYPQKIVNKFKPD